MPTLSEATRNNVATASAWLQPASVVPKQREQQDYRQRHS